SCPARLARRLLYRPDTLTEGAMMQGRSVLIVDNDREIVDLLSFFFEEHGFAVDTAVDGHTGFALALQRKPDAIICDVIMDRMHGFEVIQKVRTPRAGGHAADHDGG